MFTIEPVSTETFSQRLAEAMQVSGVTQTALAKALGITRQSVLLLLSRDSKSMKPENLFAAADFLGVEAQWLAVGEGPKHPPANRIPPDLLEALKKHLR
jgi:transcriptional regulator with XRE-family HTH domain